MPNKQQQRVFRQAKINALLALIEALDKECLPSAPGLQMKTGAIEEYLDQGYRPSQSRALRQYYGKRTYPMIAITGSCRGQFMITGPS